MIDELALDAIKAKPQRIFVCHCIPRTWAARMAPGGRPAATGAAPGARPYCAAIRRLDPPRRARGRALTPFPFSAHPVAPSARDCARQRPRFAFGNAEVLLAD